MQLSRLLNSSPISLPYSVARHHEWLKRERHNFRLSVRHFSLSLLRNLEEAHLEAAFRVRPEKIIMGSAKVKYDARCTALIAFRG